MDFQSNHQNLNKVFIKCFKLTKFFDINSTAVVCRGGFLKTVDTIVPSDVFSGCSVVTLEVSEGEKADWTTAETGQRVKFGLDVVLI